MEGLIFGILRYSFDPNLARVFVYLPPFISQILDFICRMVLTFILIYFEWRDTGNQRKDKVAQVLQCNLCMQKVFESTGQQNLV